MQDMPVYLDARGFFVEWQIPDELTEVVDLVVDPSEEEVVLPEESPLRTTSGS